MNKLCLALPCAALALSPLSVLADGEELDFFIARSSTDSGTVIGAVSDEDPISSFVAGRRVVSAEFDGMVGMFTFQATEPGFNNPGTGFVDPVTNDPFEQPTGAAAPFEDDLVMLNRISVEVGGLSGADLFFWNGSGTEANFQPVTAPSTGVAGVTLSIADPDVPAESDGSFDDHPTLDLFGVDENGMPFLPDEGVYLASFTAFFSNVTDNTIADSAPSVPLFVVLGTPGASEAAIDAGFDFVSAAIPEPTGAALALLATVGIGLSRKK